MKHIYCSGCHVLVAKIADGSKLKKGMVCLCSKCEVKRIASDLANNNKPRSPLSDLFGGGFGRGF